MAYIELIREENPETLYCATFFLAKAGVVVPGGFRTKVDDAMHGLVHVLSGRGLDRWGPLVESMSHGVEEYLARNPSLTWTRFEVPEQPSGPLEPAIAGMSAGTSGRRFEEYRPR